MIGKGVQITHGKHITCGKRVKFEDYSEIHGLCSDGLVFGNDVTIGRGVMIRPSSYYGGDLGKGLEIGDNSSIGPDAYVGCSGKIIIVLILDTARMWKWFTVSLIFLSFPVPIRIHFRPWYLKQWQVENLLLDINMAAYARWSKTGIMVCLLM